ncbi:uncharacterized protein LOC119612009 [Lucilia sericata]|uniref:uncharacterized protein LOC119612009 n=1 Tax=Lucilia sericata TaxID=13632 RepID=UPI0018A7FDFA|nr:uncharacterized protein LOC119612009 [Lucilia sericata]
MPLKWNFVFVFFIILNIFLHKTEAYQALLPPGEDGKCTYRGDKLEVGKHSGSAPCQSLTCQEDGSTLVEGCGKLWIQNCNRGERVAADKPYPECCKLVYKCKNPDGSSYYIERDAAEYQLKTENST